MQSYNRRSQRDIGPLAYLIIGLVIGLFIMGMIWSIFGSDEIAATDTTEQSVTDSTTPQSTAMTTPPATPVVDFSELNCTLLEDFRDAIIEEVDTGAMPALSAPYRKASVVKAKSTAVAWASDAVWTGFTVNYPADGKPFMVYTYYAPSKTKTLEIAFGQGGASVNSPTTTETDIAFTPTDAINSNLWQVTLADGWTTAYAKVRPECADWWKKISAVAWTVTLHMKNSALVWEFTFVDQSDPQNTQWVIVVDATNNTVVSKSWSDTAATTGA